MNFVGLPLTLALLDIVVLSSSGAEAATITEEIRSAHTVVSIERGDTAIAFVRPAIDPRTCDLIGLPELQITQRPENGRLAQDQAILDVAHGRCSGGSVPAARFTYLPRPGFVGRDEFVLTGTSKRYRAGRGYPSGRVHVFIDVR